jgi:hypothetical protein
MLNRGWLPCTTWNTVYPRSRNGLANAGLMLSWFEYHPPLTHQITAAPLALALGVNTSIVSTVPNLRP